MFKRKRHVTVIAEGLHIEGNVSAEGLVEVHGEIQGELNCTALHVSEKGRITGTITSENVVVNGTVDGPIYGVDVSLQSKARVTGDVHHESFAIEKGAFFDGRSKQKNMPARKRAVKVSTKKDAAHRHEKVSEPEAAAA